MNPAAKPCPYCGVLPNIKPSDTVVGPPEYYVECSNQVDCPGWPYTVPHPTEALAVEEWNAIERIGTRP